ncbi:MAG: hypothetical protein ABF293_04915 [Flavobacteriaceae bacterium]
MRFAIIITVLLTTMGACKSQKSNSDMNDSESGQAGELSMVMSDLYGGTEAEEIQVLRSQSALDKFFMIINRTRKPGLKPPAVDFEQNMVIAYCSGQTNNQSLPILWITEDPDQGMVLRKKQKDEAKNEESTAIVRPFGLYIMPVTDKEIKLQSNPR